MRYLDAARTHVVVNGNVTVPVNEQNADWRNVLEWVRLGGVIEPYGAATPAASAVANPVTNPNPGAGTHAGGDTPSVLPSGGYPNNLPWIFNQPGIGIAGATGVPVRRPDLLPAALSAAATGGNANRPAGILEFTQPPVVSAVAAGPRSPSVSAAAAAPPAPGLNMANVAALRDPNYIQNRAAAEDAAVRAGTATPAQRHEHNVRALTVKQNAAGLKPNAYYGDEDRTNPNFGYVPGKTFPKDAVYKTPYWVGEPQANGYYRFNDKVPGSGLPGYNLRQGVSVYDTLVNQGKVRAEPGLTDQQKFDVADGYYRYLQAKNQLPPRHFGFKELFAAALPIAVSFIPGAGPAASAALSAAAGAGSAALTGGDPLLGALAGGIGGAGANFGLAGSIASGAAGSAITGGDPVLGAAGGAGGNWFDDWRQDVRLG